MIRKITLAAAISLTASPAYADETIALASVWNPAVQLTAERDTTVPTADVASAGWVSADWVLEPAPASFGADAVYIRNRWRNTYLTYVHEYRPAEAPSNAQLRPKIVDPSGFADVMLAQGQVWVLETVPPLPDFVRIRTAHRGFGMSYLMISNADTGNKSAAFRQPYVSSLSSDQRGAIWYRFKSSYTDQQQCVKNNSWTVVDVDWYSAQDAAITVMDDKLLTVPKPDAKPQLTERKTLGFQSCENSNQRMVAAVRLVGKEAVDTGTSGAVTWISTATGFIFGGGVIGGFAAYAGSIELQKYLLAKPTTVYVGTPGKITLTGTLYDAKATEDETLRR